MLAYGKVSGETPLSADGVDGFHLSSVFPGKEKDGWPQSPAVEPPSRGARLRRLKAIVSRRSLQVITLFMRHWTWIWQGTAIAITVGGRVWILQTIVANIECATRPLEVSNQPKFETTGLINNQAFLPFLLAMFEVLFAYQAEPALPVVGSKRAEDDLLRSPRRSSWFQWQLLLAYLSIGCGALISAAWQPLSTSFVCPEIAYDNRIQMIGVLLDAAVIFWTARQILMRQTERERIIVYCRVLVSAGLGLAVASITSLKRDSEFTVWAARLASRFLATTLLDAIIISVLLVSAVITMSEISAAAVCSTIGLSVILTQQLLAALTGLWDVTASPLFAETLCVILLFCGASIMFREEIASDPALIGSSLQNLINRMFLLFCILLAMLLALGSHTVEQHPIEGLMAKARIQNTEWLKEATMSKHLEAAVINYNIRYNRSPPPNFDKWFKYAESRGSVVMDNYDQIWRDLLPFTAMKPMEIRNATNKILMNEWHDLGGMTIRGGKTFVSAHIRGTHRWMLDGITAMIDNFAEHLPDMDLAFNLDDECRIAVPRKELEAGREDSNKVGTSIQHGSSLAFSRNSTVLIPDWMSSETSTLDEPSNLFPNGQFAPSFYEAATAHCPQDSPARKAIFWNPISPCPACIAPYSSGQFLSNWTLSNDICLQPDSANLHGFHLSPSTFKTAHTLYPVFSQSKVNGYADILYPSPWNYLGKVGHNPEKELSFESKEDVLFWRGATSEGKSIHHNWRGMQRQRFVYLANNVTNSSLIPLLLPLGEVSYKYINVQHGEMLEKLAVKLDAGIVEKIERCHGMACEDQLRDLRITEKIDFQDHWKYKFLMDLDGAGFSGRFIPFLRSSSVPIKAALFREWYDERLVPWLHFIPVDGRFTGLWSILAYFGGWKDSHGKMSMANNGDKAKWIADQGKEFAQTMLRKEDMEIYFFRLLLEYARVVDDRRDEIGFSVKSRSGDAV